jgi:hypothetical protein
MHLSSLVTGFRLFPSEEVALMDIARGSQKAVSEANSSNPTGPLNHVGIMLVGCINYESIFGHRLSARSGYNSAGWFDGHSNCP